MIPYSGKLSAIVHEYFAVGTDGEQCIRDAQPFLPVFWSLRTAGIIKIEIRYSFDAMPVESVVAIAVLYTKTKKFFAHISIVIIKFCTDRFKVAVRQPDTEFWPKIMISGDFIVVTETFRTVTG